MSYYLRYSYVMMTVLNNYEIIKTKEEKLWKRRKML